MSHSGKRSIASLFKYIFFILIVVAAVLGLKYFFDTRTVETYTAPMRTVSVTTATRRTVDESATFSSYVESATMVPVVPFVSGTILEYNVKAGDEVAKDQVLAVVDKAPYELQLAQAKAAYEAYEASYNRLVQLEAIGAATAQDLDSVRSQMQAASAQMELAALQLSYTDVKASVEGTVIMADQAVGDIANSQTPVAVIADTGDLVVDISVPERYYSIFKNADGLTVTVENRLTGDSSTADIISIAPYIDPTTKTFKLSVGIDDPELFTIGMNVKCTVTYESHENVWALPQAVMKADGSLYYVEGGTAVYVEPQDWVSSDGWFIAPEGLEDKTFVIDGQYNILDGESVNVR